MTRFICILVLMCVAALAARVDPKLRLCHEIECPAEAVECTKSVESSADNKKLITTFICGGGSGDVLLSKVNEVDNPQSATKVHQPYKITKKFLVL